MSGIKNSWKYEKDLFDDFIKKENANMNNYPLREYFHRQMGKVY